eukprot:scaffold22350_cov124-Isochrysis_galbana.AAC.8
MSIHVSAHARRAVHAFLSRRVAVLPRLLRLPVALVVPRARAVVLRAANYRGSAAQRSIRFSLSSSRAHLLVHVRVIRGWLLGALDVRRRGASAA